jgi:hypothetical protein
MQGRTGSVGSSCDRFCRGDRVCHRRRHCLCGGSGRRAETVGEDLTEVIEIILRMLQQKAWLVDSESGQLVHKKKMASSAMCAILPAQCVS